MSDAERVQTETLKLLLQVVFADHAATDREASIVVRLAHDLGASEALREDLPRYLRGELALPAPDLGVLRAHRDGVLAMAHLLLHADGAITRDEAQVVSDLEAMLGA